MTGSAFGKSLRLLRSSDFQAVFDDAPFRASHKHLLVLARPSGLDYPRLGLVIAKKNIRLAVQRNRIKRIARESFRLQQHKLAGIDAIVLARRELDVFDNRQLHRLFQQQWQRICQKAQKHHPTRLQDQDKNQDKK
ncbi:ribonuclease P protein component [Exilibacterium tricleocarpae]|uniref:Ribonuclease P protein component n=1 Tax=Exilibacterium tricleocarpae TaxID=2591008 RepID=A0A545TZU6_9GAMM|nr:ribonuclease P protein component [Exilibacterium tricleocarpae]TQV82713.1 ribonuclease P protein component [Exilibacterium tricleocarpae]